MGSDPSSIWEKRGSPARRPSPAAAPASAGPAAGVPRRFAEDGPATPARLTLKEASRRYGVSITTLRAWCRAGEVDAVMGQGPQGRQWLVLPASVASRKRRAGAGGRTAAGPSADGTSMLVPRDAWDRLLAQLGHLHEAGQQLADARERAAKAETEATFLRERLAEMRQERDGLRQQLEAAPPLLTTPTAPSPDTAPAPEAAVPPGAAPPPEGPAPRRRFRLPFRRAPRAT